MPIGTGASGAVKQEVEEREEKLDAKCIVKFRTSGSYSGTYGFDWLRGGDSGRKGDVWYAKIMGKNDPSGNFVGDVKEYDKFARQEFKRHTITWKIFFFLILFFFSACDSGKSSQNDSENDSVNNSINNKNFQEMTRKKFNIDEFNKNKDESEYWYFTDADGYNVVQYSVIDVFVEYRRKPEDLFGEYRTYYSDGNLKEEKQQLLNNGFFKGKGYRYDSTGRLIEEIDYDIPYKYTWENILDFIKDHTIDVYDSHTLIQRYKDKEKGFCWLIMWKSSLKAELNVVMLSGEDGNILEERTAKMEK